MLVSLHKSNPETKSVKDLEFQADKKKKSLKRIGHNLY